MNWSYCSLALSHLYIPFTWKEVHPRWHICFVVLGFIFAALRFSGIIIILDLSKCEVTMGNERKSACTDYNTANTKTTKGKLLAYYVRLLEVSIRKWTVKSKMIFSDTMGTLISWRKILPMYYGNRCEGAWNSSSKIQHKGKRIRIKQ